MGLGRRWVETGRPLVERLRRLYLATAHEHGARVHEDGPRVGIMTHAFPADRDGVIQIPAHRGSQDRVGIVAGGGLLHLRGRAVEPQCL